MKKIIYIIAFTLLGFLLQLLIHRLVETWYTNLLIQDYETYGLGLSWANWFLIHNIATVILVAGGLFFGFLQGRYWWKQIYLLRRWKR